MDIKPSAKIPTAEQPPTEPAMPPPPDQDERRKRAEERLAGGGPQELRAKALELATQAVPGVLTDETFSELFTIADVFAAYIKTGAHPTPPPQEPVK